MRGCIRWTSEPQWEHTTGPDAKRLDGRLVGRSLSGSSCSRPNETTSPFCNFLDIHGKSDTGTGHPGIRRGAAHVRVVGNREMRPAWQKSHQVASVDLEELQDLLQAVPDFGIDALWRKSDQPGGEVGEQPLKPSRLSGSARAADPAASLPFTGGTIVPERRHRLAAAPHPRSWRNSAAKRTP